jgi:hypothetical protein
MTKPASANPWARPDEIIQKIRSKIDLAAIEESSTDMRENLKDSRKKLKGIYFDADVAILLDKLKARRVNVSGFVNEAVKEWVVKNGQ